MTDSLVCRACGSRLSHSFVDLGLSPLANSYVSLERELESETFYPLHVRVCERCWLVQLPAATSPEAIFSDYAYFSSYSDSWLASSRRFAEHAIERLQLGANSRVVEVASNDGYLLQAFAARRIPVLGIEPAKNVADEARRRGIETLAEFFGETLARALVNEGTTADLLVGNNVFAHVPDLNDFTAGLAALLSPSGTLTLEFPSLLSLIEGRQFDTIYHEHFSYFSLGAAQRTLARHGLTVVDVDELPTHGGSYRLWCRHSAAGAEPSSAVERALSSERAAKLDSLEGYMNLQKVADEVKNDLLGFLLQCARDGKSVAGYGAPAKGNTLLNFAGIKRDLLEFTVDRSPYKHGRLLPGTRIPILEVSALRERRPDFVLILPWNLRDEIIESVAFIREWGGQFVLPLPALEILK